MIVINHDDVSFAYVTTPYKTFDLILMIKLDFA